MSEQDRTILQTVQSVPCGRVLSYGDVAKLSGIPGGARRVAPALKKAPPSLKIPWHRIVNAHGKISLPASNGTRQVRLLRSEGIAFTKGRIDMTRFSWMIDLDEIH